MGTVRNIHEREIAAPAAEVGALLDRLSGPDDPLWPSPGWAAMRFDRPLGVGARGGHGPIRYEVTEYEPGHRVRFDLDSPGEGFHELTVEPLDGARCRVRHVLEVRWRGTDRLLWPTGIRPIHDTMIEEVFDNVERAAAHGPARAVRWSPWVRLLNRLLWPRAETVEPPRAARLLAAAVDRPGYRDAYRMALWPGQPRDPAAWSGILRDAFPVLAHEGGELLLDVNTAGLTARASILIEAGEAGGEGHEGGEGREGYVTLSTAVAAESLRARLYWGVVRRAHPVMARAMLRRTHRALALAAPDAATRAAGHATIC
ncbi:SRPBCC family protein [Streptomyces sp. NPDC059009]|uniref:SRPBCC family protein n=1 Tax=Streptomyces sp. NPDC059009 TaxID=3346694 RepID=UPI0036A08C74